MDNLEEKMGAILNNPQLMQQIMSMAQSLGDSQNSGVPPQSPPPQEPSPELMPDPAMLQNILRIAGQTGIDSHQKALLGALKPYLTGQRIAKLEKAMRAAKLAKLASSMFGNGILPF